MATHVALIRGINLGPKKKVPMAELRAALEADGFDNVRTLLASGNVVLDGGGSAEDVSTRVARVIAKEFGHDVGVMARTAEQIADIVDGDPMPKAPKDGSKYFVAFLSDEAKGLPGDDFGDERYVARGKEIYMSCPDGLGDSRLWKAIDERKLGVRATTRNWNTVLKIREVARSE